MECLRCGRTKDVLGLERCYSCRTIHARTYGPLAPDSRIARRIHIDPRETDESIHEGGGSWFALCSMFSASNPPGPASLVSMSSDDGNNDYASRIETIENEEDEWTAT
jgi:hypothetical protein